MKTKILEVLHFFKLDVLLLRVLERLSAGLIKKCQGLQSFLERFIDLPSATETR